MRPALLFLLVAVTAAARTSLAAQQVQQRVVRDLSFEGNRAIDDYTLSTAIATSASSWAARYWWVRWIGLGEKRYLDELELRRDVVRLILLYRQSGYMNAVVDTVVRRTARDAFVRFRIHEGEPVRVARFDLLGLASVLDTAALRHDLPLHIGDPFNRFLYQASSDTVHSRLRNLGFPYADVYRSFQAEGERRRAEVALEGVPGRRMRIGAVEIEGLRDVDTATVRRILPIRPGGVYRQSQLYRSQRELYGLGVFRSANVLLVDSLPGSAGDSTVRILVQVEEGPRHRVRVGTGYGSVECFRLQAGWGANNFLGGARALDITGRLSKLGAGFPADAGFRNTLCRALRTDPTSDTLDYSLGVTLQQPAFPGVRQATALGVFVERRSELRAYTRQAVGFNLGVIFNARGGLPLSLGYGYSVGRTTALPAVYCSIFRACADSDQVFLANRRTFAALTATVVRDRVNSPLDPTAGSVVTATLMHSSRVVGSDPFYEFNRGELEIARYHPIGRRAVFAWRVRSGTILPQKITLSGQSANFVPPEQRFYGGGPNSVRGYGRNELGPRVWVTSDTARLDSVALARGDTLYQDARTVPTGGNSAFVLNAELRLPSPVFPQRMRLGLFVDVGQVWERGEELVSVKGVRVTPGVGVRFATPLGPVRLDVAYNGYAPESGPLLFQTDSTITRIHCTSSGQCDRYPKNPRTPDGFFRRLVLQFAVGQAF
ncbi:MAG: BamA/TamA family outer membrane protein [Gemmatimonadetes bacterium]|nr:BamA/TamA family outer membrane protein [Gemmatimonadota bacterium]